MMDVAWLKGKTFRYNSSLFSQVQANLHMAQIKFRLFSFVVVIARCKIVAFFFCVERISW